MRGAGVSEKRITLMSPGMWIRNGVEELHHQLTLTIDEGAVTAEVLARPILKGDKPETAASTHPAVAQFHRDLDATLTRTAYAKREVYPFFKPEKPVKKRRRKS